MNCGKVSFDTFDTFDISETLKMHIILDHYKDHMRRTGQTLLKTTAEWTEATQSSLRKFEEYHYYIRKTIGTEEQKSTQNKSTVHFNSINMRDK